MEITRHRSEHSVLVLPLKSNANENKKIYIKEVFMKSYKKILIANENIENPTFDSVFNQFDNKEVLYEWFYCYDNFDWVVYVDNNDDDEND